MKNLLIILLMIGLLLTGCSPKVEEEKPELLFYIGITMVKPVNQLVETFELENNCDIKIIQGGSQDLYDSLKQSQKGDLYMPGSYSYRGNNLEDGLLLDAVLVGYNQASLVVKEGNPLGLTSDLNQLIDPQYKVVICNPESGSIGKQTKKILESYGNYDGVFENSVFLTTDSRNITEAIVEGNADVSINWHATTTWEENKDKVDSIPIDESYAKRNLLLLNLTSTSENVELTKKFMEYARSDEGRQVFLDYGFLMESDLETIDEVEFK